MPTVSSPCDTGIPSPVRQIEQLRAAHCDEIVLLPLYPQYSSTTTGSSLNEWKRLFHDDTPVHSVETFYRDTRHIWTRLYERVNEALSRVPDSPTGPRLFSARTAFRCR